MPRPYIACATDSQKSTLSHALTVAASVYMDDARDMAFHYAFISRGENWLRLAHQFARQRDEAIALLNKLRLPL